MNESIVAAILWSSLTIVLYTYVGYPLVVGCCARLFGKRFAPRGVDDESLPTISLLIAAHNEQAVIDGRIRNALESNYPERKLEVAIGSDGSSDKTNEIVGGYRGRGVQLFAYPVRRGKAEVLNDSIPKLSGEIIVLSDANTEFEPDAIMRMAQWFVDPEIGVVCGHLRLTKPGAGSNVDYLYWKYETFLKRCESQLGALLGANGAIYAIRKELFTPVPLRTTVEDMVIPLRAKIQVGCKLVYDPDALAVEATTPHIGSEFRRRCRNGAGGYQSLLVLAPLINPKFGWTTFAFVSHKLCRWITPFCLPILLLTNAALLGSPLYQVLFGIQVAFYSLAIAGLFLPFPGTLGKAVRLCTLFSGMNLALICGLFVWLSGRQRGTWQPTNRDTAV